MIYDSTLHTVFCVCFDVFSLICIIQMYIIPYVAHISLCCLFSCVQLFVTPWTLAHKAPLSMGFSWQEHWSGLPFPPPGGLPQSGIKPTFSALAGGFFTTEPPGTPVLYMCVLVAQSRPTLSNPTACSPPGSSVHRTFQARILE